tara:strand:+ start:517 stop:708 length:192 start_codon:yes stop_codon:yes gene_type:complete
MKKSKINPEEIEGDINNILNIITKLENLDLNNIENKDINKIQKEAEKQQKLIKNKYKDLDSKE